MVLVEPAIARISEGKVPNFDIWQFALTKNDNRIDSDFHTSETWNNKKWEEISEESNVLTFEVLTQQVNQSSSPANEEWGIEATSNNCENCNKNLATFSDLSVMDFIILVESKYVMMAVLVIKNTRVNLSVWNNYMSTLIIWIKFGIRLLNLPFSEVLLVVNWLWNEAACLVLIGTLQKGLASHGDLG